MDEGWKVTRMRKALSCMACFAATSLLVGCYPRPYDFTRVPVITGVLVSAGKPVTGVTVYVAQSRGDAGNHCLDMRPVATTDSNGYFQVGPIIERRLFASLLNPPQFILQETSICFEVAATQYLGMTVVAPTLHPKPFAAACDLAAATHAYVGTMSVPGSPVGICSNPEKS